MGKEEVVGKESGLADSEAANVEDMYRRSNV